VKHSERHRRRHFERAPEFALQAARHLLGLDDIGKDAASPLVIGLPGLGQAETRVVRWKRLVPNRASSDPIRLLTTDLASPSRCAAPEKLAASAARTNTVISSKRLIEFRLPEQSIPKIDKDP
jgi:hypothetical protein